MPYHGRKVHRELQSSSKGQTFVDSRLQVTPPNYILLGGSERLIVYGGRS